MKEMGMEHTSKVIANEPVRYLGLDLPKLLHQSPWVFGNERLITRFGQGLEAIVVGIGGSDPSVRGHVVRCPLLFSTHIHKEKELVASNDG